MLTWMLLGCPRPLCFTNSVQKATGHLFVALPADGRSARRRRQCKRRLRMVAAAAHSITYEMIFTNHCFASGIAKLC